MSKKIRILRILNRLNLGGPTYNASFLTKFISKKYKTILISGKKLKSEKSSKFIVDKIGVKIKVIDNFERNISLVNDIKVIFTIIKIIKKFKPHIIHTHASKAGFIGRIAGIICGTQIMIHTFHGHIFHSYFGKTKAYLFILIERLLAFKTNKIIALSNKQKKELTETFKIDKKQKFKIINLGFDISKFNKKKKNSIYLKKLNLKNHKSICAVGRLTSIKNLEYFIDIAHELIIKKKINIKIIIVGDGEQKKDLINYALNLGLKACEYKNTTINKNYDIVFTSWINDIENLYSIVDIVCNTSLNEGTPLSLLEAMAAKKTVISTNVGGIPDIIKNGFNGYCFNINEKNKMINKIKFLLKNNYKRNQIGLNGFNFVKKNFSYQNLIKNMEIIYENEIKKLPKN